MKRLLIVAFSGLALTGCLHDFRQDPQEQHTIYKDKPTGHGDPSAMSCYPSPSSVSRVKELDCRRNSEWAAIHAADNRGGESDALGGIGGNAAGGGNAGGTAGGNTAVLH